MTLDLLFAICTYAVLPAWLLLIVAPHWSGTQWIAHSLFVPVLLGAVYGFVLATAPEAPPGASFSDLRGVMALFTMPEVALAGWIHYLAFDLFIGAWQVRDAQRREIPHLWVIPCLVLTLMLGPVGLALYLVLRWVRTRALLFEETA
ncbi:MAG: ABA4-like family protein [Myxococcota bacterium]